MEGYGLDGLMACRGSLGQFALAHFWMSYFGYSPIFILRGQAPLALVEFGLEYSFDRVDLVRERLHTAQ